MDSSAANILSDADCSGISSFVLSSHDNDDIPINLSLVGDFMEIDKSTTQPSNSPTFRGPPSVMKLKGIEYNVIKKSSNKRGGTSWIWEEGYCLKNRLDTDAKLAWMCKRCYIKNRVIRTHLMTTTNNLIVHMKQKYFIDKNGAVSRRDVRIL